jgi:serine/threonine protein kinase
MVLKFESLEPGLSGSLEESSGSTQYTPSTDNGLRTTVDGFVDTLKLSGLSGPVLLSGRPERIGEGGQFYVSKQEVVFLERDHSNHSVVAIKRPKYPLANSFPIDLANPQVERNLKHVSNEIRALSNERLRYHPNIVKLLSWAWDVDYSRSLVLVLELAREDLESALAADPPPNLFLRVRFCSDVANGLDAIHDANLVHGDLKPANVLIFFETFRPVAKLADFGYSVGQSDCVITGTAGWQAPEKKASVPADCFSYGLLIWSTLLLDGQIPNHAVSQSWMDAATADLEVRRDDLPREVFVRALDSMKSLLDADPARRRCHLGAFFASTTELKQQEQ